MTDTVGKQTGQRVPWRVNAGVLALEGEGSLLLRTGGQVVKVDASNMVQLIKLLLDRAKGGELDLTDMDAMSSSDKERFVGLLEKLAEAGLLSAEDDGVPAMAGPVDGLFVRAGGEVPRDEIARRLARTRVGVLGAGLLAGRVVDELSAAGVSAVTRYETASSVDTGTEVAVVLGHCEEDPVLTQWNERALAEGGPAWLAVTPLDSQRFTVGPWVFPHTSACFHCYRLRRSAAFLDEQVASSLAEARPVDQQPDLSALHPALSAMQAGFVADLVLQHVGLYGGFGQAQPGGMTTVEYGLSGIQTTNHRVLRVPRCPRCSPAQGGGYPQVWFHRDAAPAGATEAR